jgi:beta-glucosidase
VKDRKRGRKSGVSLLTSPLSSLPFCFPIIGTHYDWTLSIEERLDYLSSKVNLTEKISQLTNDAPQIARLGIPAYNWLNDDE